MLKSDQNKKTEEVEITVGRIHSLRQTEICNLAATI